MINKLINLSKLLLVVGVLGFVGCGVGDDFESNDFAGTAFDVEGTVITPINLGGLFIQNEPSSSINFGVTQKGPEVSGYSIYKQLNGGDRVLHGEVSGLDSENVITLQEAANGLVSSVSDLTAGDIITITFESSSGAGNFISTDRVNSVVACPPEVQAVTYNYTASGSSTDGCCPGTYTTEGEVVVTFLTGIDFTISDWSAGLYFDWYSVYGITEDMETDGTLQGSFQELCLDLSGSFGEPFGTATNITGNYDPETGVIEYSFVNGYDDTGKVTLTPQ